MESRMPVLDTGFSIAASLFVLFTGFKAFISLDTGANLLLVRKQLVVRYVPQFNSQAFPCVRDTIL